jgi:hypothetical protein
MIPVLFAQTPYCETPILKAQRIGIGKLNNPALAEGIIPRSELAIKFPKLALGFIPVIIIRKI